MEPAVKGEEFQLYMSFLGLPGNAAFQSRVPEFRATFPAHQQAQANARMCDGDKAPPVLSREMPTLVGCVYSCYMPAF